MEYNIVVVDDDPVILDEARNYLSDVNMHVTCLRSGFLLLKYVEKNTPDLVLLDVQMPELDGFDTYIELRRYEDRMGIPRTTVIFISGEGDQDTEEMGLVLGASDVILKPFKKDILVRRINNAIKNTKRIESLTEEAAIDKLTGFLSKSKGVDRVSKLCKRKNGALMVMDLDSFKLVNDLFGHKMGDNVLKAFARVAKDNSRETDTICRIGGDEFMAFFEDISDESVLESISARINKQLVAEAKRLMGEDNGIPLGVSIGAVMVPEYGRDYETLFGLADSALYKVKQDGKHGCRVYSSAQEDDSNVKEDLHYMLDRTIKTLEERNDKDGGLLLGRESFAAVFRFLMRFGRRFREKTGIILLELEATEGDDGDNIKNAANVLSDILQKELQVSDMYMHYRSAGFCVMKTKCDEAEIIETAEKLVKSFKKSDAGVDVKITYVYKVIG